MEKNQASDEKNMLCNVALISRAGNAAVKYLSRSLSRIKDMRNPSGIKGQQSIREWLQPVASCIPVVDENHKASRKFELFPLANKFGLAPNADLFVHAAPAEAKVQPVNPLAGTITTAIVSGFKYPERFLPLAAKAEEVIFAAAADMTQRGLMEFVTQRELIELIDDSVGTINAEVQRLMMQLTQPGYALITHDDIYVVVVMDLVAAQNEFLMTTLMMQEAGIHFGQLLIDQPAVSNEERGQKSDFWQQQHGWVEPADDIAESVVEGTVAADEALLAICVSCFASIDRKYTSKLQSAVGIMDTVLVHDVRGN